MRHQGYVPLQCPPEDHSFLLTYRTCRDRVRGTEVLRLCCQAKMGLTRNGPEGPCVLLQTPPPPSSRLSRPQGPCSSFSTAGNSGGHLVSSFCSSVILSRTWSLSGLNQFKPWSSVNSARPYLVYFCGQASRLVQSGLKCSFCYSLQVCPTTATSNSS